MPVDRAYLRRKVYEHGEHYRYHTDIDARYAICARGIAVHRVGKRHDGYLRGKHGGHRRHRADYLDIAVQMPEPLRFDKPVYRNAHFAKSDGRNGYRAAPVILAREQPVTQLHRHIYYIDHARREYPRRYGGVAVSEAMLVRFDTEYTLYLRRYEHQAENTDGYHRRIRKNTDQKLDHRYHKRYARRYHGEPRQPLFVCHAPELGENLFHDLS